VCAGTFGVVFEATLADGRKLAVKRVLQDARYRNRELSVMRALRHPSCVELQSYFYTSRREDPSAIYLNLVCAPPPPLPDASLRAELRIKPRFRRSPNARRRARDI
jgi:serine/threonine protein kinase